jgi:hypothetical protein
MKQIHNLMDRVKTGPEFPTTFCMSKKLHTSPHYTDSRFDEEQVIFGKKEGKLGWDYSDRFSSWDYEKDKAARVAAKDKFEYGTANYFQEYLGWFFEREVVLKCIIAGVNKSNGYPYLVFGYK